MMNSAVLALGHLRPDHVHQPQIGHDVVHHDLLEHVLLQPAERPEIGIGGGVADHDVDPAIGLARLGDQVLELRLVGDAGGHRRRLAALFLDALHHLLAGRQLAAGDDDLGAVRGHLLADRAADAAAAAGHHRHLAGQVEHHPVVSSPSCACFDLSGARTNSAISSTCADHRNWSMGRSFSSRYPPSCSIRASRANVAGSHEA